MSHLTSNTGESEAVLEVDLHLDMVLYDALPPEYRELLQNAKSHYSAQQMWETMVKLEAKGYGRHIIYNHVYGLYPNWQLYPRKRKRY